MTNEERIQRLETILVALIPAMTETTAGAEALRELLIEKEVITEEEFKSTAASHRDVLQIAINELMPGGLSQLFSDSSDKREEPEP